MRRLVFLSLVSGCAFTPMGEGASADDVTPDATSAFDAVPQSLDAVDPWPCGVSAPTIATMVMTGTDVYGAISDVSIAGGGNTAVSQPGAMLSYSLTWSLRDSDVFCTSCRDQIEVGIVAGTRQRCVYDDNPPQNQLQTGTATIMMTAPATPGVYSLRFQVARDFSCDAFGRSGWWLAEPGADKTFGVICVP